MRKFDSSIDVSAIWSVGSEWPEVIDFSQAFQNNHPVELEIGSGKGLFLLRQSQLFSNVNFVGLEWAKKYAQAGAARMIKRGITNVRVVSVDARVFVPRIPDASLAAAHIYFPDPWWKRRQRKRRIVEPEFIALLAGKLRPQSTLWFATDVQEYFEMAAKVFAGEPQLSRGPDPEVAEPEHDLDYLTHFERKYRKEGRAIFRARYIRQ